MTSMRGIPGWHVVRGLVLDELDLVVGVGCAATPWRAIDAQVEGLLRDDPHVPRKAQRVRKRR